MLLADQESRLAVFAEGMVGRYFHIRSSAEFSGQRLMLAPDRVASSRDTVYLPATLETPVDAAYRVLALQQLAYHEFGTFAFKIDRARQQIAGLDQVPIPELNMYASDFELFYHHVDYPGLLRRLFNIAELTRVTRFMFRNYPGIRRHYEALCNYHLATIPPVHSAEGLIDALYVGAARIGLEPAPYCDATGLLAPALIVMRDVTSPSAGVYDAAAAALTIYQSWLPAVGDSQNLTDLARNEDPRGEESTIDLVQREVRLEDWQDELADLEAEMLAFESLMADDASAKQVDDLANGELRPDDIGLKALKNERDNLARRINMERSSIRQGLGELESFGRTYRYDEWDYLERRYINKWCRLYEQVLEPDVDADLGNLIRVTTSHRNAVKRQFEQIKPLGLQRMRHMLDGDELDLTALVEARQDVLTGQTPDERIYSRRDRVHRDLCTAFLVDLSASTDDAVESDQADEKHSDKQTKGNTAENVPYQSLNDLVEPEEPERRIIDLQRESMLIMAAALEQLGDSYGIYGFSGYGHDCVEFFVAKEPQQPFNRSTLQAIAAMKPKRSTRMGPAIRHATNKLVKSGNALKVLIIVSDGFPQDCDYGPERGDHEYGLQDTAKALKEAESKGVETFCVTVDRSGNDYLRRMCPSSRYVIIEEVEELPEGLSKVYEALTA